MKLKQIWFKSWRLMGIPYRLHNWLLSTATRVVEFASGAGMLGYALVFQLNGEGLAALPLYYKFAALPRVWVVGVFAALGLLQFTLLPFKSPRSNVLSGFVMLLSATVWILVFAAFDAAPRANTGMVFSAIMAFLCAAAGSRLIDLNKHKYD